MNDLLIYINDNPVEISRESSNPTKVVVTVKFIEIGLFTKRYVNRTNRFLLPSTEVNDKLFEFINNPNVKKTLPYSNPSIRIIQNGFEVINGKCTIVRAGDFYEVEAFQEGRGFFDVIKDKYCDSLPVGIDIGDNMDNDFLTFWRTSGSEISTPVIDYGRMIAPSDPVTNPTFRSFGDSFEPWENVGSSGVDWVTSGTGINVTLTSGANANAKTLSQQYGIYKGYKYRVVLTYVITGTSTDQIVVQAGFTNSSASLFQGAGSGSHTTNGTFTIDGEFTATANWSHFFIGASRTSGSGTRICRPVALTIKPVEEIDIKMPFYLPVIEYGRVVQTIFSEAGYTGSIPFSKDITHYSSLFIAFSKNKLRYSQRWLDTFNFEASNTFNDSYSLTASLDIVDFPVIVKDSPWYDGTNTLNVPVLNFDLRVKIVCELTCSIVLNSGKTAMFMTTVGGVNVTLHEVTAGGVQTVKFESPFMEVGSVLTSFRIRVSQGSSSGTGSVTIFTSRFYSVIEDKPLGRYAFGPLLLPEITQLDFIRDMVIRFALIPKQSGNTIIFKPIKDIINDKGSAVDWTKKRDKSYKTQIAFSLSSYAKKNKFSDDGSDSEDEIEGASYDLEINNPNLEEERTIYESFVKACSTREIGGLPVLTIPLWDFSQHDPFNVTIEDNNLRIVSLRSQHQDIDPVVKYAGTQQILYKVAVYHKDIKRVNTGTGVPLAQETRASWEEFVTRYMPHFKTIIEKAEIISNYYKLDEQDVHDFDPFKLIYDDGNYYIVNVIKDHDPDISTEVELIKIL